MCDGPQRLPITAVLKGACKYNKTLPICLTEGLLDFYLTANNETRKNVTGLIKEAISSSVRVADNNLVIGILGTAVTSQIQL